MTDLVRSELEMLKESINAMNQRMDSFVDQIHTTKQALYSQADRAIIEMESRGDRQYERLQKSIDDIKEFESLKNDFRENSDIVKNLKKELSDNFKLKDAVKSACARLSELESYFEKYNLEVVMKEISKIEKEYQKKIASVLSGISIKKSKK